MLAMIWAQGHDRVIGQDGTVPWHVPEDLALFKSQTQGHPVIMGRKTWESLPDRSRPLPGRENFVISTQSGYVAPGAEVYGTLIDAITAAEGGDPDRLIWCIGGAHVYAEAMANADLLVITDLDIEVDSGDAVAPAVAFDEWDLIGADPDRGWHTARTGVKYRFTAYARRGSALSGTSDYFGVV